MCTVTCIPTSRGIIITSNRDERIARGKAISPEVYEMNGVQITFPKDPKGGGTWIAHTKKKVIVLLNGAQDKHKLKPSYKKSRGLIVLDLISAKKSLEQWHLIDLEEIEPFTIIILVDQKLYELQWNELEKTQKELPIDERHIWSSSTLYTKKFKDKRANWFTNFLLKNNDPTEIAILDFHQFTELENKYYGMQINRNEHLKTISITQCFVTKKGIEMKYIDLLE